MMPDHGAVGSFLRPGLEADVTHQVRWQMAGNAAQLAVVVPSFEVGFCQAEHSVFPFKVLSRVFV